MKKILVVRYRFIGDTVLTIPFLRNLKYSCPDAQIDMIVAPNSGEILEGCPYVDNFIFFDTTRKHKYENGKNKKKSFFYYVSELRKKKYDKAYILKRSLSSALLCYFAGIKERIGFDTEHRGFLLTKKVKYDKKKEELQCFLDVLRADNIEVKDTYLENWISKENTEKVTNLFKENNISPEIKKAAVNVTATNEGKVWNIDNFARIIEYLSNEKKVQVIFIGAESDKKIYENIPFKETLKITPVNLCGETAIKESLALLKKVDFILGNDSGTLHMASSVNTKVIGLYGPMPFEKWKVSSNNNILLKADLPCMPCSLKIKCPNNKACMNSITVEQVKQAIDKTI